VDISDSFCIAVMVLLSKNYIHAFDFVKVIRITMSVPFTGTQWILTV